MILTTTLVFAVIGYLFYSLKKEPELELDDDVYLENSKDNDDLYKDLEDLFI